jgi:hypothetical protein
MSVPQLPIIASAVIQLANRMTHCLSSLDLACVCLSYCTDQIGIHVAKARDREWSHTVVWIHRGRKITCMILSIVTVIVIMGAVR